ncbi:MEDS domain-containing protein [Halalkalicoccus ordinarius]|uniref:MEDS domain-containing protein n=1 Tax=Halalkalicoccus ordinarius TaxID=3116651 RepID=UPI00300EA91A
MSGDALEATPPGTLGLESGLEALRSSPTFRGPVEPLEGHDTNDHLALVYETNEERFAAVVPFMQQGLEEGERCLYVVDESSESEVLEALRLGGIDVDAALESGALTIHSVEETYLRNGTFEPDEMLSFYADAIEDATAEYEALRVGAETSWILEEETTLEKFMEYESKVNELFHGEDCIALCQYDRTQVPAETLSDIVRIHPHLVYDDTVCHNFYYTPPEEFFGPERPEREVERMLGTLLDRTRAKTALQDHERFLRALYETTADPQTSFMAKIRRLLEMGCERFDLEIGYFARTGDDTFEILEAVGDHELIEAGVTDSLRDTYCEKLLASSGPVSVIDAAEVGWTDDPAYDRFGLDAYFATTVHVGSEEYGTLCFASETTCERPYTDAERALLDLMGQWVSYELDRQRRERYLRESYEITSDHTLSFERKLDRLLEMGCEWFGLEMAGLNYLPSWDGSFRLEKGVGFGSETSSNGPITTNPSEGCFCRRTITESEPVAMTDVHGTDWEDDRIHREVGLTSYLGTKVTSGTSLYGTLWFGSTEPRERPFSEAERTFIELIGQWIGYEIERRDHERSQRALSEIAADTDRTFDRKLRDLFDLGCERFDLELGGIARVDPETDLFEVEAVSEDHEHLVPGARVVLSETYCRVIANEGGTAGVTDPMNDGFADTRAYEEFGVRAYLGTRIELDGDHDRTLFFVASKPRDREFSEAERTFQHLMGQWVKYELERERREGRLTALNEMSRELTDAETPDEVADCVIRHAQRGLQLPLTTVAYYDEDTGELSTAAQTASAEDGLPTATLCAPGTGAAWDAFVLNKTRFVDGDGNERSVGTRFSEVAAIPLARHGVFLTASTSDGFGPSERDFLGTVAATIESVLTRTERKRLLQERERTLESQNETLQRLNRVNGIIRNIDQALVRASTRSEIEAVVCTQLARTGPYDLAWIGGYDAVTGDLTPRERDGDETGDPDLTADTVDDERTPTAGAITTREPQVVDNVLTDPPLEEWQKRALDRGYRSIIALPLVYKESLYGVLTVYTSQPGVFDGLEGAVLEELSDTIAYAMHVVESRQAIVDDSTVELEFDVGDLRADVTELVERTDGEFEFESVVPRSDGSIRGYFTMRGATADEVSEAARSLSLTDVALVTERDGSDGPEGLFEATLTADCPLVTVLEHGATPRGLTVTPEEARFVVELAAQADVRQFVERLRARHSGMELVAKRERERERTATTRQGFGTTLSDELTDRQLEVLKTAYASGYFESPRERTGTEIATTLDISQPTFNTHLRTAHRKLCGLLFEGSGG